MAESTAAVKDGVKGGEIPTTVRRVVRAIRVASRGAPKHGLKPYGHRIAGQVGVNRAEVEKSAFTAPLG